MAQNLKLLPAASNLEQCLCPQDPGTKGFQITPPRAYLHLYKLKLNPQMYVARAQKGVIYSE